MKSRSKTTRRDSMLALLAAGGAASTTNIASAANDTVLPSATFRFEDMAVRQNGQNRSRAVLDGATHDGFPVELHITELGPGQAPHGAHKHPNEELLCVRQGTLEVTIENKVTQAGPGSVVYVASNEMHGWKNAGTGNALYFVIALGKKKAS